MLVPLLLTLAAQISPQISTVPVPPPIWIPSPIAAPSRSARRPAGPTTTLDVEVRGGGEILWSGQMRVSDRTSATLSRQQTNAASPACPTSDEYDDGTERSSLTVSVNAGRRSATSGGLDVRASWDRPSDGGSCQARRSVRTVGIVETVWIEPGREQTIAGDGGLTIRLRRR